MDQDKINNPEDRMLEIEKRVITLPNEEELKKRLRREVNDDFLAILLKYAGQEKNALGVLEMLIQAIEDYAIKDSPNKETQEITVALLFLFRVHRLLKVLIDDKEVLEKAMGHYWKAYREIKLPF